jgi:hypothetical protein
MRPNGEISPNVVTLCCRKQKFVFIFETMNHRQKSFRQNFFAGLPDGIFSNQKSQIGKILEDLGMEDVGVCII